MITSSNFFNKNLFAVDQDEEIMNKLDEGQWMPIKTNKPFATLQITKQQLNSQTIQQHRTYRNNGFPKIQDHSNNRKYYKSYKYESKEGKYFTHRSSINDTDRYYEQNQFKKPLKSMKLEYLPNAHRYSSDQTAQQYQQINKKTSCFMNTRKFRRFQKYRLQQIDDKTGTKDRSSGFLSKGTKITNKNTSSNQISEIKSHKLHKKQYNFDNQVSKICRNYSPLANQLNFILNTRRKSQRNMIHFNTSKTKNKLLNNTSKQIIQTDKAKVHSHMNYHKLQKSKSKLINIKI